MGNNNSSSSSAAAPTVASPATAAAGDPRPIGAKVEQPSSSPSEAGGDPRSMEVKIDSPSSSPSETSPPETLDTSPPLPEQPAPPTAEGDSTEASAGEGVEAKEDGEDEEEYECGFCIFMKAGGCKDPFVAWEECIEEAQKTGEDPVDKCAEVTFLLKKCMDEHPDYYEPILRAERAMADDIAAEKDEAAPEQNEAASEKEVAPATS